MDHHHTRISDSSGILTKDVHGYAIIRLFLPDCLEKPKKNTSKKMIRLEDKQSLGLGETGPRVAQS